MPEIKCPNCGEVFQIDESNYDSIVKQVRDHEFIKTIAGAGMCSMLCSSCSFLPNKKLQESDFIYKLKSDLPKKLDLKLVLCVN